MRGNVLVVDDNDEVRELLCSELEIEGYTVYATNNGVEAVDIVAKLQPDAILLDISMPAMNGIETTRILKSNQEVQNIPVMMITVSDNKEDIINSFEVGAIDYIKKPVFMPELKSRLKTIIRSKKLYEDLQKSETKYRQLVENINEAVLVVQDGMIRFSNPKAAEILYLPETQSELRHILESIHPDDRGKILEYQSKALKGGEPPPAISARIVSTDGKIKWLEVKTVFIEWQGNPATLNLISDITERRKAEEEQQRFESLRRHSQKMEAVGTLAGGIAHEFNNLLQVVKGYAQLLLLDAENKGPGYQRLQEIVRAAGRGGELTQQLLTFSRSMESERRPVDLNKEVKQVKQLLDRTFPESINIELHLEDDLKMLNADPNQIQQTIINMAANSKDAMVEGGRLVIETKLVSLDDEFCLEHPQARPGDFSVLKITDTGHGMDRETLERSFEPFYTTKGLARHSGLGLAVIAGIVKSHNGFILSDSEPGLGTSFQIFLPVTRDKVESPAMESVEIHTGGTGTLLLVDDEDPVRELGKEMLAKTGYSVLSVADGESALRLYQENKERIDLIILDLVMPGMGGERCLGELLRENPQARIVVASGHLPDAQTKEAIEAKTRGFISKPYDMTQMLKVVREALEQN